MVLERTMKQKMILLSKQYPVITVTGPRQSGKTTLCRMAFPDKAYVSLEDPDKRRLANEDPRSFLDRLPNGGIIDEIQRVPDLLSYIQTRVDEANKEGIYVLTGSHQFLLLDSVTQSLAGRTALLKLLPFSFTEAYARSQRGTVSLDTLLYTGFYPRIYDKRLNPTESHANYVATYVERDARALINVKNLSQFEKFLKLCASRTGQILNLNSLGNECGITHNTARSWLSVLEASYLVYLLRPHYKNFKKRLIKSPKLYFLDVGLAAYLLDIFDGRHMVNHPLKGALFETFIVSELIKARFNRGLPDNLYYFRDNIGNEVDILLDFGSAVIPVEIKSGMTLSSDSFKGLRYYKKIAGETTPASILFYGGNDSYREGDTEVTSFNEFDRVEKLVTVGV